MDRKKAILQMNREGGAASPAKKDQRTVIVSNLSRRLAGVVIGAMVLIAAGRAGGANAAAVQSRSIAIGARAVADLADGQLSRGPPCRRAARCRARLAFFRAALRTDPRNGELLERAFLATLAEGDIDEAVRLAERIVQIDRSDRIARMVLGIRALKQKQYALARQHLAQSTRGPITDLTATLLSAWAL